MSHFEVVCITDELASGIDVPSILSTTTLPAFKCRMRSKLLKHNFKNFLIFFNDALDRLLVPLNPVRGYSEHDFDKRFINPLRPQKQVADYVAQKNSYMQDHRFAHVQV
jgi:hypothetical protein